MLQALGWAEYLWSHAQRLYASVSAPEVDAGLALLRRIRNGDLQDQFTAREVYRRKWPRLNTPEDAAAGIDLLCDYDWLMPTDLHTGGRLKILYGVNPRAL